MNRGLLILCILMFVGMFAYAQTGNYLAGTDAGANITGGDYNIAIGDKAGNNLTSSSEGVYIGYEAGYIDDNATDNVIIGFRAGYYNESGDNTFVGNAAGFFNTLGDDNTFIGERAGARVTTGEDNTFVGAQAGNADRPVFITTTSADNNNPGTGSDNTAVGSTAGGNLLAGYRNTFVGNAAGHDLENGYRNTFVGDSTGIDLLNGRLNAFFGQAAGSANEHANYNTFIGALAGADVNRTNETDGSSDRNTYVGVYAGAGNREGGDNVGIGAFADVSDYNATDLTNAQGFDTVNSQNTKREFNTFVGAQTYANSNNVVLLGYNTRVDGQYGIALGSGSRASNQYAMAIGGNVIVSQDNTMALGGDTTTNRVSVGIGTVAANQNATLDLSDTDKGFLVNRVTTTQRNSMTSTPASGVALSSSDIGLMVYDIDDKLLYIWNGTQWSEVGGNSSSSGSSDVPNLLNYQSVVRDGSGNILANQTVQFRMNILDTNTSTFPYSETHTVTTSAQGIVSFQIGGGTIVSGLFTDIDWGHSNLLQTEIDVSGGTNYITLGVSPFVSVPYALRAKYAENIINSSSRIANNSKEDRIKTLELEVKELQKLVKQLTKNK